MKESKTEAEKIIELIAKLNSDVANDDSLSYLSDEQYDRILEGVKKLTINIYNHKLVSPASHDRLDELTDVMTSLASLDFSKRATVEESENHLDYIAIGLNLLSYQLAKQVEPMKLLKAYFESAKDPILVADSKNNVLLINNAMQRILGIDTAALYQKPVEDILKKDTAVLHNSYNRLNANLKNDKGQLIPMTFSFYEFKNDDGLATGSIYHGYAQTDNSAGNVTSDITKLEENNPLDFNRIHHDISGPIKSIKGAVALGKINANDKETLQIFEIIEKCRQSVEAHFTDLFDMIFLKSNKLLYNEIVMDELIHSITNTFTLNEDYKNVSFNVSIGPGIVLYSNRKLVNSILHNLISNALKYSNLKDAQSFVGIRVTSTTDKGCVIEISDNGIGIQPENIASIFKPHFRASFQAEGKGLGLYIVTQAVQKLGGTIEVQSTYGSGSTFTVTLPNIK